MTGISPGSLAAQLQSALARHREGRLDEAEELYQHVLECQPRQQDAIRLLGVLKRQRGDLVAAQELLELASRIEPAVPDTHHDLGLVWFELQRYREAVAAYQRALEIRHEFPEAHYNLGNAYYAMGEIEHAHDSYLEARNQQPDFAEVHFNLGHLEQHRRNDAAAVTHYEDALRIRPEYPDALLNLGLCQTNLGALNAAASNFRKALALKPEFVEAWLNLGDIQQRNGALREAELSFRKALELQPSNLPGRLNLAMVLNGSARLDDAIMETQRAVDLAPENTRAHAYLGALLLKKNQVEAAITCSNRALVLDPGFIPARVTLSQALLLQNKLDAAARECETILNQNSSNVSAQTCLGVARSRQRRPWEAIYALEKAVELDPSDAEALVHLAIGELLLGRFVPGWKHYEARWDTKITSCVPRRFTQPRWKGENISGCTVLLYGEQGFGDTIQFCRYAPLVSRLGCRVILECQPSLKDLLKTLVGADQVFGYGETLPDFDLHIPLLGLPAVFQTTMDTIPAKVPYLAAPAGGSVTLPPCQEARLKVGFAWCGSRSQNHDSRPLPLESLRPLLDVPGIGFYSFQTGERAAELKQNPATQCVVDLSNRLTDFSVTARLVEQLDLVLTIDTALAHLAGAMGKQVWVLLPFAPDWRWGLESERSPWYPSMRLIRQSKSGDWSEPVNQVVQELQAMLQNRI